MSSFITRVKAYQEKLAALNSSEFDTMPESCLHLNNEKIHGNSTFDNRISYLILKDADGEEFQAEIEMFELDSDREAAD